MEFFWLVVLSQLSQFLQKLQQKERKSFLKAVGQKTRARDGSVLPGKRPAMGQLWSDPLSTVPEANLMA